MKHYTVTVNNRPFRSFSIRTEAIDMARLASEFFAGDICRVTHKNGNTVKGTPTFVNGKEI